MKVSLRVTSASGFGFGSGIFPPPPGAAIKHLNLTLPDFSHKFFPVYARSCVPRRRPVVLPELYVCAQALLTCKACSRTRASRASLLKGETFHIPFKISFKPHRTDATILSMPKQPTNQPTDRPTKTAATTHTPAPANSPPPQHTAHTSYPQISPHALWEPIPPSVQSMH